jgi:hypothetical protein
MVVTDTENKSTNKNALFCDATLKNDELLMGKFLEHYHKRSWPATFSGQATANETESTQRMMQQNNTQPTGCWWC